MAERIPPKQITTLDLELAVMRHFNHRQNVIVPNVSWGMGLHECDMLVVRKSGYAVEVEIKISAADLRKDKDKHHGHQSDLIRELWFCMPKSMSEHIEHVPKRAGVLLATWAPRIIAYESASSTKAWWVPVLEVAREPQRNSAAHKLTDAQKLKIMHLGCMRIETMIRKRQRAQEGRLFTIKH